MNNQTRTLLISGGSSGIGQATAEYFVRKGFLVHEISRHGEDRAGIVHIQGDVTRLEDCRRAVDTIIARHKRLDVLICNAGIGISGAIEFTTEEEMRHQMDVNFYGAVHLVQSALPYMRRNRRGRILFVSSLTALFSIPYQSYYSASKSAINAFALSLRNEVASFGIQVACLLPGDVKTGFTEARDKNESGAEVYPHLNRSVSAMERDEIHGQSAERLAKRLYKMATCPYLSAYHYEGWGYRCLVLLNKLLPATLVNYVVRLLY